MMARNSEEEEDEDNLVLRETDRISMSKPFPRKANPEDPESPGSSSSGNNRQDSSEVSVSEGEGSSSEGVLVEHPLHHDQDSRSRHGDQDSGVLVNIDGSMHDGDHDSEDGGREDTFVDAPEELSFSEGRSSDGIGDPLVLIDIAQSNDILQLKRTLEDAVAECLKYKEEREVYGKEILTLYQELRALGNSYSEGDNEPMSLSPLDVIIKDCLKLASHLKIHLDNQIQLENYGRGLSSILVEKNQEIDDLNIKVAENSLSRDVVASYLNSHQGMQLEYMNQVADEFVQRLLSLTAVVSVDDEDVGKEVLDSFSLVERRTSKLVERYFQIFSEVYHLGQCLSTVRSDLAVGHHSEFKIVFDAARWELLESKNKEGYFLQTVSELKQEKDGLVEQLSGITHELESAKAEASRTKALQEQAEVKFMTVKEKLGIAVTKGKSLVQQRDALKQLLNDKMVELERCSTELQQKSVALESAQARVEELSKIEDTVFSLQGLLSQQNNIISEVEAVVSKLEYPIEEPSAEVVDKIRWLVDQRQVAVRELQSLKDALSAVDLPETLLSSDSESRLNWIISSFSESKENIAKLRDELSSLLETVTLHESQLLEAKEKNDNLTSSISKEREEIMSLQIFNQDLKSKFEGITEKISLVSSERNQLMKALLDISEIAQDPSSQTIDALVEGCIGKVNEWKLIGHVSAMYPEQFQLMQQSLFLREQEIALYGMILEEDNIDKTVIISMSKQLEEAHEELKSKNDEKDILQKEFERVEERCSLLREKLSLAVKKGKGLVQDKEGLKNSLEEKVSEIEKLKHDLQVHKLMVAEFKEKIESLSADSILIKQLEIDIASLKEEREQMEQLLRESNHSFHEVTNAINGICLPEDLNSQVPAEKVKRISKYILDIEGVKASTDRELEGAKAEALTLVTKLAHAHATIGNSEKTISEMEKNILVSLEEKEDAKISKVSAEQELEVVKKDLDNVTGKLTQSYVAIRNLEDSIFKLTHEKKEIEDQSEQEIISLSAQLATCQDELVQARRMVENQSNELVSHLGGLEMLIKEDSLSVMMVEGFKKKAESLQGLGVLIERVREKFAASESKEFLDSEKSPHLWKLLSCSTSADSWQEKLVSTTKKIVNDDQDKLTPVRIIEAAGIQMSSQMERFRDLSGYFDEHITLVMQALQMVLSDIDKVLEPKETVKANLKSLEAHNQVQEEKVLDLQKNLNAIISACQKATHNLLVELENSDSKMDHLDELEIPKESKDDKVGDECNIVGIKLLDTVERIKIENHKFSSLKGISEDRINLLMDNQLETLFSRLDAMEVPFGELFSGVESFSSPTEKMTYILDSISKFQESISSMNREKDEIQVILQNQLREASANHAIINQNLEEKKAEMADLASALEKFILKFGGENEFLEGKKSADIKALVQYLERLVTVSLQVSESLKSRVQELEAKLQESQALNEDLSCNVKLLQDSINQNLEDKKVDEADLSSALESLILKLGGEEFLDSKKRPDTKGLLKSLDQLVTDSLYDSENSKSKVQELGAKLQETQALNEDLSSSINLLQYSINQNLEEKKADMAELSSDLEKLILKLGGKEFLESKKPVDTKGLMQFLDRLLTSSLHDSESLKSRVQELGAKLQESHALNEDLSSAIKLLHDSNKVRSSLPDIGKERAIAEGSSAVTGSEILEIDDGGHIGKKMVPGGPAVAHARTMRKASSDHLALNVDSESERLVSSTEIEDKGHVFKSLNASGLIPKEGKHLADRIDGIWVSAGRLLMGRPEARMGLITYCLMLHIWALLATII